MQPRAIVAVSFLLATGAVWAQSDRGTITGTVTDQEGAVVAGAVLAATNTETGAKYDTATTGTGNYTLPQLPAGEYDLSVGKPGFSTFVQKGLRIQVAQTARIDVQLKVGTLPNPSRSWPTRRCSKRKTPSKAPTSPSSGLTSFRCTVRGAEARVCAIPGHSPTSCPDPALC